MVYSGIDEGCVKNIAISCSCGCSMLEVKTIDNDAFISVFSSNWYSYQRNCIMHTNLRHFMDGIKKKKRIIAEFFLNEKEMKKFISLAEELYFEDLEFDEDAEYDNESHLSLEYDREANTYFLEVVCDTPLSKIIFNRWHRGYEILLPKKEWDKIISKMKRYVYSFSTEN